MKVSVMIKVKSNRHIKLILRAFICATVLVIVSTSLSFADIINKTPNTPPGTHQWTMNEQKNLNKVWLTSEMAALNEMVRRNDSVLDLTCFGNQLINLSSLGRLFSDANFTIEGLSWQSLLCGPGVSIGFGGELRAALGLLFNIPFGIPPFSICAPSFSVSEELGKAFSDSFGKDILGCVVNISVDAFVGANLEAEFDPPCLTVDLSILGLGCNKMSDFWNRKEEDEDDKGYEHMGSAGKNFGRAVGTLLGKTGVNVPPIEGGETNDGAPHMTLSELLSQSGTAKAEAEAMASAVFDISGGASLGLDYSFSYNPDDGFSSSGDGLTTGHDFNIGVGYNASAGYGIDFLSTLGADSNSGMWSEAKSWSHSDSDSHSTGPIGGQNDGWGGGNESTSFSETVTLKELVDKM